MDLYREFDSQWSRPQPAPRQSSPANNHDNTGLPLKGRVFFFADFFL